MKTTGLPLLLPIEIEAWPVEESGDYAEYIRQNAMGVNVAGRWETSTLRANAFQLRSHDKQGTEAKRKQS